MRLAHIELKTKPDCCCQREYIRVALGCRGDAYRLQSGQNGQREGGYLDSAADQVCDNEHEHAQLRRAVSAEDIAQALSYRVIPASGGVCRADGGHGVLPSPLRADETCAAELNPRSGCWWTADRQRHLAGLLSARILAAAVVGRVTHSNAPASGKLDHDCEECGL